MGILLWMILGLAAGWIASSFMNSGGGVVADMLLGLVGALVGGFLMSLLGFSGITGFNIYSLIVATLGAIAFISIRRAIT